MICVSSLAAWNGLASMKRPSSAPAFDAILSRSIPIVMREGNAWGLMSISGRDPDFSMYGRSSSGQRNDRTPFCPCLELNLSPMIGLRSHRTVTDIFVSVCPLLAFPLLMETRSMIT